jgi:hypothetical protein
MRKITLGVAALVVMAMAIPAGAGKADHFTADLDELNNSGVNGHAVLWQMGDTLRVNMTVNGLDPDLGHVQHIHGKAEGAAECPTLALDSNGDGFVELSEGVPAYGPVILQLVQDPTTAPSPANFPAPNRGGVTQTRVTYGGDGLSDRLGTLDDRVIVVHGLDVNDNGAYDGPFELAMPVACGVIVAQP